MRRIPNENLGDGHCRSQEAVEGRAFKLFCSQLTDALENYVASPIVSDATVRSQRALNALGNVVDDLNLKIREVSSQN